MSFSTSLTFFIPFVSPLIPTFYFTSYFSASCLIFLSWYSFLHYISFSSSFQSIFRSSRFSPSPHLSSLPKHSSQITSLSQCAVPISAHLYLFILHLGPSPPASITLSSRSSPTTFPAPIFFPSPSPSVGSSLTRNSVGQC